jgi:hypothetical protein
MICLKSGKALAAVNTAKSSKPPDNFAAFLSAGLWSAATHWSALTTTMSRVWLFRFQVVVEVIA